MAKIFYLNHLIGALACLSSSVYAQHPERRGIALLPLPEVQRLAASSDERQVPKIDVRRSLLVTDLAIVSEFTFEDVMTTLAEQSPDGKLSKELLFNQWWDTANPAPGLGLGPNCSTSMNGFFYQCPREEGSQIKQSPFSTDIDSQYMAIALSNRFDLAGIPAQGASDCGEYRIVFARRSGTKPRPTGESDPSLRDGKVEFRNLIIFEAVLPNPYPNGKDLIGCKPVVDFWASLSTIADQKQRAIRLKDFYFKGLPGFSPVIAAKNYGNATPHAKGQVRTNQFLDVVWSLREFSLQIEGDRLRFIPTTLASNPDLVLFDESDSQFKGEAFRKAFIGAVPSLAIDDINRFNMDKLGSSFNSGESIAGSEVGDDYIWTAQGSPKFLAAIGAALVGNTHSSKDIVARAQALTCAGCHENNNGKDLGAGLVWPASLGFVHVDEGKREASPDGGERFVISDALIKEFLPFRKAVFENFRGTQN